MNAGDLISDRFRLLSPAGAGGAGEVWRAADTSPDGPIPPERPCLVAVKLLTRTDDVDVSRMQREAAALARLEHPAIVGYVAHGEHEGRHWLAMEWLDGVDLRRHLADSGALSISDATALGTRMAAALDAAHTAGLVHRDLKPANVLLPGGRLADARLVDFGIARRTDGSETRLTATHEVVGTPIYMAPEQARAAEEVDARTDLYALGCVLFEALLGRPPVKATTFMAALARILFDVPPRVDAERADVPTELADLVEVLLSKYPDERPATAADVGRLLRELGGLGGASGDGPSPSLTPAEKRFVALVVARGDGTAATRLAAAREIIGARANVELLADGTVAALLTVTGVPSEQAVAAGRCALDLEAALPGAATALTMGFGEVGDTGLVGGVIDRAAALLGAAGPGEIRVDPAALGLLSGRFDVHQDGAVCLLRGEADPFTAGRTLLGRRLPCLGRDRERRRLSRALEDAFDDAAACAVVVTGAAGLGKSRLREATLEDLRASRPAVRLLYASGDVQRSGAAYAVVAEALRRHLGEPARGTARRRLEQALAVHLVDDVAAETALFLGEMLGEPSPSPTPRLLRGARSDPGVMALRIREAWHRWLAEETPKAGLAIIVEDLHAADEASIALLDSTLRTMADRPVAVVGFARPSVHERFPDLWRDHDRTVIALRPLSPEAAAELVDLTLDGPNTLNSTQRLDRAALVARAEGNPFFLEELLRGAARGETEDLPASVLGMVQARMEALSNEARRLARAASVFGQVFRAGGVAQLVGREEEAVREGLAQLVIDEVVVPRRGVPGRDGQVRSVGGYGFSHQLVREAAYATLTDADKRNGHLRAAGWLEALGATEQAVLANHYERGGDLEQAARCYSAAAQAAAERNELRMADDLAERAVAAGAAGVVLGAARAIQAEVHKWWSDMPRSAALAVEAASLLQPGTRRWFDAVGDVLVTTGRMGEHATFREWAARLQTTAPVSVEHAAARVQPLVRAAVYALFSGDLVAADETAAAAEAQFAALADAPVETLARVHQLRAFVVAYRHNDLGAAIHEHAEAVKCFEAAGVLRDASIERVNLAVSYVMLGDYQRAEAMLGEALRIARALELPSSIADAHQNLGIARTRGGRPADGLPLLEEAVAGYGVTGNRRMAGATRLYMSECLQDLSRLPDAEAAAREGLELLAAWPPERAAALGRLAAVLLAADRPDEALEHAGAAMQIVASVEGGLEQGEAEVRAAWAEALEATGSVSEAEAAWAEAVRWVEGKAAALGSVDVRRRFLHNNRENARIMARRDSGA